MYINLNALVNSCIAIYNCTPQVKKLKIVVNILCVFKLGKKLHVLLLQSKYEEQLKALFN